MVSLAQIKNIIINLDTWHIGEKWLLTAFTLVSWLWPAFWQQSTKGLFPKLDLVLSTAQKPKATWLNTLPLTVEQVSCVSDQEFHTATRTVNKVNKGAPRNASKDSSQSASPGGPPPELPTPYTCGSRVFAFLIFSGDTMAAGAESYFENCLPGDAEVERRGSISSFYRHSPMWPPA